MVLAIFVHDLHSNAPILNFIELSQFTTRSEGHSLLYFAYTCAHDLFIWGAMYLNEKIILYGISQNKGKFLILIHPINNYNLLGGVIKKYPILLVLYFFPLYPH